MRRDFGLALFALLYGSIIAFSHWLLILRLVLMPQIPSPLAEILVVCVVALGTCLFIRPFSERWFGERFARMLAWPTFVWMGMAFFLLISLLVSDVSLSLFGAAAAASGATAMAPVLSPRAVAAIVTASALSLSMWGLILALRPPRITRLAVDIAGWPHALDGFRIVQLSDMHIGPLLDRRFARTIVARVNLLRADLIAVTGDLVDGRVERLSAEVEPLRGLESRHGTFFVTGNHDYFSRVDPWLAKVSELGWRVLRNERVTIGAGGDAFDLAGVDDRMARRFGADSGDLERALEGRDPEVPVVLLAHNPNEFDDAAAQGVDLQLSGHTHGGQMWPFGYFVRLATPYVAGLFRRGRSLLYVSRGTGFWGPPMRLFHPAEITEITVRAAAE
ncbi:MAG TPA: metallophosphoesterase [Candidatus Binatia bacterium]|nr:metallophosphoesterase [Candidatus Binatia bacterium]